MVWGPFQLLVLKVGLWWGEGPGLYHAVGLWEVGWGGGEGGTGARGHPPRGGVVEGWSAIWSVFIIS